MVRTASRPEGFTLIEVMVALAVVALALPALLFTLSQHIDGAAYLRDKSMAQAVAANRLAELRLVSAAQRQLFSGKDSGQAELAGRDFFWWVESSSTEVEDFYRVEITVALAEEDEGEPLYELVAFMSANVEAEPEDVAVDEDPDTPPEDEETGPAPDADEGEGDDDES